MSVMHCCQLVVKELHKECLYSLLWMLKSQMSSMNHYPVVVLVLV